PHTQALNRLNIYSLEQKKSFEVTDGWYSVGSPEFSSDGKYLFFVSSRDFNPVYTKTEWNHAYLDMERIYFVTLAKESRNPFAPKSDEVGEKSSDSDKDKDKDKEKDKKDIVVKVDVDGLKDRILGLQIPPSSYRHLTSTPAGLYFLRQGTKDAQQQLFL